MASPGGSRRAHVASALWAGRRRIELLRRLAFIATSVLLSALVGSLSTVPAAASPPIHTTVHPPSATGATVLQQANSLSLPAGHQLYIYGFSTGGGEPSTGFSTGTIKTASDSAGDIGVGLAATTGDHDSFSTESAYSAIGGVATSGFSTYTDQFAESTSPGPTETATTSVDVPTPGALVLLVGVASSSQTISITGSSKVVVDASSAPQGSALDVEIAQISDAAAGSYSFTLSTYQSAGGQTPGFAAALLGVFVLTPGAPVAPSGDGGLRTPATSTSPMLRPPVVTSVDECTSGLRGLRQSVVPGRLVVLGGGGTFSNVAPGQLTVATTPGGLLSGEVVLSADNSGQSFDVAPLIGTPSWGDPATSYWTIDHSIPTGSGTYTTAVSLTAPNRPGTYHVLFAFALEEHGYDIASATNWAAGAPPQWGNGDNIAELDSSQIAQAQHYGCAVDRWTMQTGPRYVLVAAAAITVTVAPTTPASAAATASRWRVVPAAGLPGVGTQLNAVTCATSSSDCWAVGSVSTGPTASSGEGPSSTVALHWDGDTWRRVTTPSPSSPAGPADSLDAIACPAPNDCWAGGWQGAGPGTDGSGLLLHWDGHQWAEATEPALMKAAGPVVVLACASVSECWAAGSNGLPGGGYLYGAGSVQSLLRYSKHSGRLGWSLAHDAGNLPPTAGIKSLACSPHSGYCWMAGAVPARCKPTPGLQQPCADTFVAGYSPSRGWLREPTTSPPATYSGPIDQFTSVACNDSSSCWAVGDNPSNAASLETSFGEKFLADHWNGSTWSPEKLSTPPPSSGGLANPSVACLSTTNCWLLGDEWSISPLATDYATAVPTWRAVAEHWNGRHWSATALAQPDSTDVQVAGVACSSGSCFAVGYYTESSVSGQSGQRVYPLILQMAARPSQAYLPGSLTTASSPIGRLVFAPDHLSSPSGHGGTQRLTVEAETCAGTAIAGARVLLSLRQKAPYAVPFGTARAAGSPLGQSPTGFTTAPNGTVTIDYHIPRSIPRDHLDEVVAAVPGTVEETLRSRMVIGDSSTLRIVTSSLPCAEHLGRYHAVLEAAGGKPGYTWSMANPGTLPSGLALGGNGVLQGVPGAAGAAWFVARVTDSLGASTTAELWLTIGSGPRFLDSLPPAEAGSPYHASLALLPPSCAGLGPGYQAYQPCGGTPPFHFSVVSGALPPGVTLSADGSFAGTPTAPGSYGFTLRVTDTTGSHYTNQLTLDVGPLVTYLSRREGPTAGGTSVTVAGIGLTDVTAVHFVATTTTASVTIPCPGPSCTPFTTEEGGHELRITTPLVPGNGSTVLTWVEAVDGAYESPADASMCSYSTPAGGVGCDQYLFEAPQKSATCTVTTVSPGTATLGGDVNLASSAAVETAQDAPTGNVVDSSVSPSAQPTAPPQTQGSTSRAASTDVGVSSSLGVDASLALTPSISACATISGFSLRSFSLTGSLTMDTRVALSSTSGIKVSRDITLGLPLDLPGFPVAPGVLVFPTASLQLDASGNVIGNLSTAVDANATASLGLTYSNGRWQTPAPGLSCGGQSVTGSGTSAAASLKACVPVPTVSLSVGTSLSVRALLRISFLVEDLAGPYIELGPKIALDTESTNTSRTVRFCHQSYSIAAGGGSIAVLCASIDAGLGVDANPILGLSSVPAGSAALVSYPIWVQGSSASGATNPVAAGGAVDVSAIGHGEVSLQELSGPPPGVPSFGDPRYFIVTVGGASLLASLTIRVSERARAHSHRLYWWSAGEWRPIGGARSGDTLEVRVTSGRSNGPGLVGSTLFDAVRSSPPGGIRVGAGLLVLVASGGSLATGLLAVILSRRRRRSRAGPSAIGP